MSRVFVAMSGGVDSSVAAALLAREGHEVCGVTLALLPEGDAPGACCGATGARDARRVCDSLGIPHYVWNAREVFSRFVIGPFADAYASGETPNPCIACNDIVKADWMLARALANGADGIATGHYARVVETPYGHAVARGADPGKDQSYFLYRTTAAQLELLRYPVGGLRKTEVRALADELGLPTARTAESQEICFAPADGHAAIVAERHPEALEPGPILDEEGNEIGRHAGMARYTVGQRQGLGLPGGPWFVLRVDSRANALVVGPRERLAVTTVRVRDAVWPFGGAPVRCEVAVRYRMKPVAAVVTPESADVLEIVFDVPVEAVSPGQHAVAWDGDIVLGGGQIE